jgi:arylsulfatase A-like enzyme
MNRRPPDRIITVLAASLVAAAFARAFLGGAIDTGPLEASAEVGVVPPQNVIIFLADDLDWSDLPFFNPPKEWSNPDSPTLGPDGAGRGLRESSLRLPDFNRLAARMLAVPRDPDDPASPARLGSIEADGRDVKVVPIDLDGDPGDPAANDARATADGFSYFPQTNPAGGACASPVAAVMSASCEPGTDILRGYGGLARLAREGLVFPRFYSTSARCSPARAALLTGRHNNRAGVIDISDPLNIDEVTIADFLKQGCTNPATDRMCVCRGCGAGGIDTTVPCDCFLEDPATCEPPGGPDLYACYTTGMIGKWHLGSQVKTNNAPWQRGFDEYIGFKGGKRGYFKPGKLQCSPTSARYCIRGESKDRRCTRDADCGTTGRCALTGAGEHGLYVGPQAHNPCHGDAAKTSAKHVDCCEANGVAPGFYAYNDKRFPTIDSPPILWGKDTQSRFPCNDDGDTRESGCLYYTRRARDHARDFILRHADAQPFLLVVGFNAPHVPHQAPRRTKRHYVSGDPAYTPTQPDTPYWAMIEELDAAIGSILSVLDREGVCDANREIACSPSGNECPAGDRCLAFGTCAHNGFPCTHDGQCGASQCVFEPGRTLAERTLVMFTSDNGHNNGPFGDPATRGGKGTVYEGGIRVGLLARAPGLGLRERADIGLVGSFVDVFPTVAAAAGYRSRLDADGRLRLRVCAKDPSTPCQSDADCPGAENRCVRGRAVDGRNLLPMLTPPFAQRNVAYARFLKDTETIVTRQGYFSGRGCGPFGLGPCADSVCGLDERVPEDDAQPLVRRVRGASCVPCKAGTDCGGTELAPCATDADCVEGARCDGGGCKVMCEVLGKVCADEAAERACNDDSFLSCPLSEVGRLTQCDTDRDCLPGQECIDRVRVACNDCVTAAWKLRANNEMYDLASNPEEDQKLFKRDRPADGGFDKDGNGRLNCYQRPIPGLVNPCFAPRAGSAAQKLCNVQKDLALMLGRWSKCVQTPICATSGCVDCDDNHCEDAPATCN